MRIIRLKVTMGKDRRGKIIWKFWSRGEDLRVLQNYTMEQSPSSYRLYMLWEIEIPPHLLSLHSNFTLHLLMCRNIHECYKYIVQCRCHRDAEGRLYALTVLHFLGRFCVLPFVQCTLWHE